MRVGVALMAMSLGCGTILNSSTATVTPPPGATVAGSPGPVVLSQQRSHEVIYPDGRRCILESRVGAGYVIADIVFFFLVGVVIDAATGNWKSLDADSCPGVIVD